jgi:predicted phosphodiesterase
MKVKTTLARKYRDLHGMEMPIRTLARILYAENEVIYKDYEDARLTLRYIEGKKGSKDASKIKNTKYFMAETRNVTPYKIPQPDSEELKPFILPTTFNNFIFASDFHVPNHRIEPIEAMIKYANDNNIRQLILGGDLLDNTPFTRWLHEPINPKDVPRWFDMAKELLLYFTQHFDTIYFIEGNHDFWYKRFLMEKAPMLFHDTYFTLEERLGLNNLKIRFIDQRYLIKAGKLNIHHGHLTFRGGGGYANAARMLYMKSKSSMLCGHVHVESSHTEPDIDDSISTTFTVGCMCTLRPEYQPFGGKACHGFAHIQVSNDKSFSVKNYRIYKGKIL